MQPERCRRSLMHDPADARTGLLPGGRRHGKTSFEPEKQQVGITVERSGSNPAYKIIKRKNGRYAVEATARANDPPIAFGSFATEEEAQAWTEEHAPKKDNAAQS